MDKGVPDMMRNIVLHGPESTGKSTLAVRLADHYDTVWVPEYGRTYCERYGTDLAPDDLVRIMEGHVAHAQAATARARGLLIQDTDPLMTAAWSMMLFGHRMTALDAFDAVGDLYMLMDIDLPWVADSIRLYAERERQARFFALCEAELVRRAVPYVRIGGDGKQRFLSAVAAIEAAGLTR
jgi:NadR type nicotinamide-nucleotide adenylyltransferase